MSAPLLGCWEAVSLVLSIDGEAIHPLGLHPRGQLIYTGPVGGGGESRMSVQVMAAQRSSFASGDMRVASAAEFQAAFETCISYFGSYEIDLDRQIVRHRIEASAFPNWTGKIETRAYRFVDGLLELRAPPERFAGREVVAVATWRAR
ncbi:hypothetical protein ENSA5_57620 [Enhygromyxa salina]|uniref:Lipocalin-like domain-containing protein n=1 Tax=Enhygromyxa salina TaxID=215803 RepID=A0A2S9XEK8_9BACT|nr:lipocalin-like domain-containing protein [Enhygromyxa salina]PRP91190.1 hypothetical protein ENSA5_57620 [Enhygromyxa salina]